MEKVTLIQLSIKEYYEEVEKGKTGGVFLTDEEVSKLSSLCENYRLKDKWVDYIGIDVNKLFFGNPFYKSHKFRIVLFTRIGNPQMNIGFTKQPDGWYIVSGNWFKDLDGGWLKPFKCRFDVLLFKVKELFDINK